MHRLFPGIALSLLMPIVAGAQHFHHHYDAAPDDNRRPSPCADRYAEPVLDASIRKVPWKVSTTNTEAQAFFEQGMTLLYGFNYEGAMQNFRAARRRDPELAIASWGIALGAGPNLNITMDGPCGDEAMNSSEAARGLAEQQHKTGKITELEYQLVLALPPRYAGRTVHAVDYAVAMRKVWNRFPSDANVAALYAESLMDLRPWALFNVAKQPAIDTTHVLEVLSGALAKHPDAVGANHYWIHAVEAGPKPGSAKASADLLSHYVPGSGHLLHMPSHTYELIGDYGSAFDINKKAVDVDIAQYGKACEGTFEQYSKNPNCLQWYFGHYAAHNHYFRAVAGAFLGRRADSLQSARDTETHVQHFVANEPGLQRYMTAPLMLLVAQHAWDAVLKEPEPPESCYSDPFTPTGCHILRSIWHWARGMAHAAQNHPDIARGDYQDSIDEQAKIAPPTPTGWGNNNAASVLTIANEHLLARIAWAEGRRDAAIEHLKLAVTAEDALVYDEPPQWVHPSRQSLGGAYLAMKHYHDAKRVFTEDLDHHAANGRSLYGLYRALLHVAPKEAGKAKADYEKAWKRADYKMTDEELW